ncbi:hypothetical protein ORQ98_29390, partial [Spartinivicinus sp. A2-2]|nr:hypothetical protein [Spartinivicinus sp. A2-2]
MGDQHTLTIKPNIQLPSCSLSLGPVFTHGVVFSSDRVLVPEVVIFRPIGQPFQGDFLAAFKSLAVEIWGWIFIC